MKKLDIWRRRTRDEAPGEPAANSETHAVGAGAPAVAGDAPTAARLPVDDEVQRLRQAAMLQHEDTVPAAFYRASAD